MDNFQLVRFKQAVNNRLERFPPGNSLIDQVEKGKTQQISHVLKILERQQNHTRGRCEDAGGSFSGSRGAPRISLLIGSHIGRSGIVRATRDDPVKSRSSEEESIDRKVENQLLLLNSDMEEQAGEQISLRNDAIVRLPPGVCDGAPS